jgi:DNA-binding CsgD family transcriptional regulator
MDTISNTQMQVLTLNFIIFEVLLLIYHLPFLSRPSGYKHIWYLLLLILLLIFNFMNGVFPDLHSQVNIKVQYIIAYGSAYLMGAYVPFYFYKAFALEKLRFHALYGVPLFELGSFLLFNVLLYVWNGNIKLDSELGVMIPFVYGFVVLTAMYKAIRLKYKESGNQQDYREQLAVFVAILPWQAMAIFAFCPSPQWLRIIMANLGLVVITLFLMVKTFREYHFEFRQLAEFKQTGGLTSLFEANCIKYELTQREIDFAILLKQGYTYQQISLKMFLSPRTVGNNIQALYTRLGISGKMELIHKLWYE